MLNCVNLKIDSFLPTVDIFDEDIGSLSHNNYVNYNSEDQKLEPHILLRSLVNFRLIT